MKPIVVILASLQCHFEKMSSIRIRIRTKNQTSPYVLECCRVLEVEGHDGNIPLVGVVGIVHFVGGGENGAIPLLHCDGTNELSTRSEKMCDEYAPDHC